MDPAYIIALIVIVIGVALTFRAIKRDHDDNDDQDTPVSGGGSGGGAGGMGFHIPQASSK